MCSHVYLKSDNIELRAVEPDDVKLLSDIENDSSAWDYSDTVAPFSLDMLRRYAENYDADIWRSGQLRLMAWYRHGKQYVCVGVVDLYDVSIIHRHAKIGIYTMPRFRREGIARKLVDMTMDYANNRLGLIDILALVVAENNAAIRLFEDCGFTRVGMIPGWVFSKGENVNTILYCKNCKNS